jgi:nicotinate phosphoribosyltransferase
VSQVHFAMKFGMKPVGTIAHEWIMAVGAKQDYVDPNGTAMDLWEKGELFKRGMYHEVPSF